MHELVGLRGRGRGRGAGAGAGVTAGCLLLLWFEADGLYRDSLDVANALAALRLSRFSDFVRCFNVR